MHKESAIMFNGRRYTYFRDDNYRVLAGPGYNWVFNTSNGVFARWGRSLKDDPQYSLIGPEIADIEIGAGYCPNACPWCYKSNGPGPVVNMTVNTFKSILDKFPPNLTQVALGITGVQTNPDLVPIMEYCREKGIVPNLTMTGADLTPALAQRIGSLAGAISVSVYPQDKQLGYRTIKMLNSCSQVNMHLLLSDKTLDFVYEVLEDVKDDSIPHFYGSIVFLTAKPKGRAAKGYKPVSDNDYAAIVDKCFDNNIKMGFDSCSAPFFTRAMDILGSNMAEPTVQEDINGVQFIQWKNDCKQYIEPCESALFSTYINVKGDVWNCSFAEGEPGIKPVSMLSIKDYLKDVWYSPEVSAFRARVLATSKDGLRYCPVYPELRDTR